MAGTEYSGPDAAVRGLFEGKTLVVCDAAASDPDAVATVEALFQALPMRVLHLGAADHDLHTAYVSHISHLTSFALALTVLEKEQRGEQRIFDPGGRRLRLHGAAGQERAGYLGAHLFAKTATTCSMCSTSIWCSSISCVSCWCRRTTPG